MARRAALASIVVASLAAMAYGQIVDATVDILSPGDEGYEGIPANLLVLDVFVDVASADAWTASGLRVLAGVGSTFVYFEPNNPPPMPPLVNPGRWQPYSTFLSRPRPRNSVSRFENGAAAVAGSYFPLGANAIVERTELSAAWFASPPIGPDSPSEDGYVARIAIDLGAASDRREFLVVTTAPPPAGSPVFLRCATAPDAALPGFGWATFDQPSIQGMNWYVWDPVPEPAALALLLVGALGFRRREM